MKTLKERIYDMDIKLIQTELECELTDDINEAIWLLPSGAMVYGDFDCGIRGLDHNVITYIATFEEIHCRGWLRIVPETMVVLYKEGQLITTEQVALIQGFDFIPY